jgi:predicted metal-dependent peptidase
MRYTREEREDLARRKEQWVLRAERGEDPERVRRELKLKLRLM